MKAITIAINHILTTQRNCLEFHFEFILGEQLIINRNKLNWETLNTPKIKTLFYSGRSVLTGRVGNDYGTKLRIKCHQRIQRKEKTIDGELCTNWDRIDSFGVGLDNDDPVYQTDVPDVPVSNEVYENFYDDPPEWWSETEGDEVLYNNRFMY